MILFAIKRCCRTVTFFLRFPQRVNLFPVYMWWVSAGSEVSSYFCSCTSVIVSNQSVEELWRSAQSFHRKLDISLYMWWVREVSLVSLGYISVMIKVQRSVQGIKCLCTSLADHKHYSLLSFGYQSHFWRSVSKGAEGCTQNMRTYEQIIDHFVII